MLGLKDFNIRSYPFILLFTWFQVVSFQMPQKAIQETWLQSAGYSYPSVWHTPCHIAWEQHNNLQPVPPSYVAASFGPAQ